MTSREIRQFLALQVNEITEYMIYTRLAQLQRKASNRQVLNELAQEEYRHYHILKKYTHKTPSHNRWKVFWFVLIARLFGLTFSIRLMEKGEVHAQDAYRRWDQEEELQKMADEEEGHEKKLIDLIHEEGLNYMGSIVLGLNDALVEFTGALAGYAFALQNSKMVALTGSITGIAAALSMAASEYLSTRTENDGRNAIKASIYTGITYLLTVVILILPFTLMGNTYWALAVCLTSALTIIAIFNFYYSVVKEESFKKRFLEMAIISTSIATISFFIGYALRVFTGINL